MFVDSILFFYSSMFCFFVFLFFMELRLWSVFGGVLQVVLFRTGNVFEQIIIFWGFFYINLIQLKEFFGRCAFWGVVCKLRDKYCCFLARWFYVLLSREVVREARRGVLETVGACGRRFMRTGRYCIQCERKGGRESIMQLYKVLRFSWIYLFSSVAVVYILFGEGLWFSVVVGRSFDGYLRGCSRRCFGVLYSFEIL